MEKSKTAIISTVGYDELPEHLQYRISSIIESKLLKVVEQTGLTPSHPLSEPVVGSSFPIVRIGEWAKEICRQMSFINVNDKSLVVVSQRNIDQLW